MAYSLLKNDSPNGDLRRGLAKISKKDHVFLVFIEEGKEEGLWLSVEKIGGGIEGRLIDDGVRILSLKKNDKISFQKNNIFHLVDVDATQKLIEEYQLHGKVPGISLSGISAVTKNIYSWIQIRSPWVVIDHNDKKQFIDEMKCIEDNTESENQLEEVYKLFLSLIFMIVLPQIIRASNIDKEISGKQKDKLAEILDSSAIIYRVIADSHLFLLEQLRTFHSSSNISNIPSEDLGWYFAGLIEEAMRALA